MAANHATPSADLVTGRGKSRASQGLPSVECTLTASLLLRTVNTIPPMYVVMCLSLMPDG